MRIKKERKMADNNLYRPDRGRSAAQTKEMVDAEKAGRCVFCQIDFKKNKPLNKKGEVDLTGSDWKRWWVWENPYPQEHQKHIMFVLKRHVPGIKFYELYMTEWMELIRIILWTVLFFGFKGFGFVFRGGDTEFNAGSIPGHFHAQIQAPDGTGPVKATFFKDMSPEEQARRANRSIYSKKNLECVEGYIVYNEFNQVLRENFRWGNPSIEDHVFVHTKEALGWIYAALKEWGELSNLACFVKQATWTASGAITLSSQTQFFHTLFMEKAIQITEESLLKYKTLEGVSFQDENGYFLNSDFNWSENDPYYFHWHAERYVEEALYLLGKHQIKAECWYVRKNMPPSETKCDSLNWIDDREEFEIG